MHYALSVEPAGIGRGVPLRPRGARAPTPCSGVFLQTFLLAAAAAEGLGTCAQASLASYPHVVRRHFDVPDGYRLLCGISIGWPAKAPENHFRPGRMTVGELLIPARLAEPTPLSAHG